jgi:very-short-patch-repair endonuclease
MERYWDEFSNFRSAIEWPDMRPPEEHATANLVELGTSIPIDVWAAAIELAPRCDDSPIEVDFGARLITAIRQTDDPDLLKLIPQYELGPYRYDFAIFREGKLVGLIECDGKEFHSTERQLANDLAKNKLATKEGVYIFRFSGSDIYRNGYGCVRTVLHTILAEKYFGARLTNAIQLIDDPNFLKLIPQYELGRYRYDFAIFREGKLVGLIACDGKEFRSTEQRLANDLGVYIFRFSSSDIYQNINRCARTVLHTILKRNHLSPTEWQALNTLLAPSDN